MSATTIQNALPGESLIGIEPELLQQVDPGWRHRLALFNGRALTAAALQSEQAYRAGRLATLGQCVTHGIVEGLELSADLTVADPVFLVTQGYGISATGEDLALPRTLRTTLSSLLVIDPQTSSFSNTFPNYSANSGNAAFAGVLLLQPVAAQVSGASIDTGALPVIVSGNLNASCDQDPEEYAFEDWQIVDGVRLVLVAWPSAVPGLVLPSGSPSLAWRNLLAYTVFNAEMALTPDDRLPWDVLGVPVALVVFDTKWKPLFVDRSSVVRAGGLARSRYALPAHPSDPSTPLLVQPALAQARISQLTEQINATPSLANFVPDFAFLPPCGVLPSSSMDFDKKIGLWFPPNWTLSVGPVYQEEVETVLLAGMTAQPLDVTQNEAVEVLVPLPDALYDPNILITEIADPAFKQALDQATKEFAGALQHRKAIQQEANALFQVLTGTQQPCLYDLSAGLTPNEIGLRDQATYSPAPGETFGTSSPAPTTTTTTGTGTTPLPTTTPAPTTTAATTTTTTPAPTTTAPPLPCTGGYVSLDLQKLIQDASTAYTLKKDGNGNPLSTPLPLFNDKDMNDLGQNGLQHFIDLINGKLSKANDLLDLAFLTTQADIYRFRQFILGASGATALAVSPIVAQIATGESAAVTSSNLQNYLSSIIPSISPATPTTTTTPPPIKTGSPAAAGGGPTPSHALGFLQASSRLGTISTSSGVLRQVQNIDSTITTAGASKSAGLTAGKALGGAASVLAGQTFVPQVRGTVDQPASPNDVLSQSPITGAQLNIRTMTIAQRMANPPSQEGLFYSIANRVALLELLADLEITIDDIAILVDVPPTLPTSTTPAPTTTATGTTPPPQPMPLFRDFKNSNTRDAVVKAVQNPVLQAPTGKDPDEGSLFSAGIKVLEQHSSFLRAVEVRIRQYNDFLGECRTALSNIQADLSQAQTLITQLDNAVVQSRQNVAFTTGLSAAESQRVVSVNAQRTFTLKNNVQMVVFTRARTLEAEADVPSRQLVPGNITSPVPSCLQQSVAIPPELREIVALLREAPVSWMPIVQALLNRLERPLLLQNLAVDAQVRANLLVQLPARVSSAVSEPGVYAPAIADIYNAHQQAFSAIQTQRAGFQPALLVNQSWASRIQILRDVIALGDLLSSSVVHSEVVNATSRLMQQISSVATCLYARASQALPADRLAWAEFLRAAGLTVQMQSLAVLPNWNPKDSPDYVQNYVSRQQMQMLVDWLFQQIDTALHDAVAFMSDVVRVAILLASDAPVDEVIGGAVTLATTPVVGGIVSLTLPSDRVAHGMYVHLYSAGGLAAQAVVSDLDSSGVRATVTQVFQPGAPLQANDVAHFSAQPPQAVALRAFDR